jgi:hypothetical protein
MLECQIDRRAELVADASDRSELARTRFASACRRVHRA